MKTLKELEIILSSFECNKNCPYCTAKSTRWPLVEDDIQALELATSELFKLGYTFKYLTVGGNGEPTLHSYEKLASIVDIYKDKPIQIKRVLTSGNIFKDSEEKKFNLFNDNGYVFEITVTSSNQLKDMETLGYDNKYLNSRLFKKAKRVRVNYVMLKDNNDKYLTEIKNLLDTYPNIETASIKLLNINTNTDDKSTNMIGDWIIKHGIPKSSREEIKDILNKDAQLKRINTIEDNFDTMSWEYNGKEIYFSYKSTSYGQFDLVWYGDRFVDYKLNRLDITDSIKRVYIAKSFDKQYLNGKLNLSNDMRDRVLKQSGYEGGLMDYSSDCFIELKEIDNGILHYIGPFYNEKAGLGILTSTECDKVVSQEKKLIELCDIFVCYFNDNISPGTIAELIYAATLGKKIIIYYKLNSSIDYELKTENWFPITLAKQIQTPNIEIKQIKSIDRVVNL